ncbi:MAG: sugar-binding domain-containing protein [Verrucomicrobiota bacterium]
MLRSQDFQRQKANFDDTEWKKGFGGFGIRSTPGSRVGTTWSTGSIWLRKSFELTSVPAKPALLIHHDEDADVFINGKTVATFNKFTSKYIVVPLAPEKRGVLKAGKNVMAVRCKQTTGGQFIDVHLVDADKVPDLPEPKRSTKPFVSDLVTKWGASVTPENAWTEYPRPQLKRDSWTNLNGEWDYSITPIAIKKAPSDWSGKILVPFSLESRLSGVQRLLDVGEALWYRRSFKAKKTQGKRLMLNFEAVDYRCEVFVNGRSVGTHTGGNTPFSFEITDTIKNGTNELVVRVEDATEKFQLRGKQVINARGIWYTQVSGIWQTVWLEEVSDLFAERVKIDTKTRGKVSIRVTPNGRLAGALKVEAIVRLDGKEVARSTASDAGLSLDVKDPKLWTPDSPVLYDLELRVNDDVVHSYFGIREVGKAIDADGHWRFTLNGEPIFHWGPLDQGWWPDGLLTPPSDEAMLFDVEWLKKAGFNMIRKHIKIEPRRYYYHCDRLGMMVWQDQVSGGVGKAWPKWTRLKPDPVDAKWPKAQHEQFMSELDWMITALENHPSIVSWVPFNERWGQHRTMAVGKWTVQRDPSRLINVASGGNFWPVGDIVDAHKYPHPEFPFEDGKGGRFDNYIKVMGEFGGHGYPVKGHLWDAARRNWGYGGLPQNAAEYKERYVTSLKLLNELRDQGIAGGVYTQTTDVEGEINGLMTYDRKVIKIPAKELAELHEVLFEKSVAGLPEPARLPASQRPATGLRFL